MKQISFEDRSALPGQPSPFPSKYESPAFMRQRAMADLLMRQGQGPVSGWGEAIGKLAQTGVGAWLNRRADQGEATATQARAAELQRVLQSDDPLKALQASNDPQLQSMGLQHAMARALKGENEVDLVQVYDPMTKQMVWKSKAQAAGMGSAAPKTAEPQSAYAKMKADVDAGLVPQSALDQWWQNETRPPQGQVTWSDIKDANGNIVGQRSSTGQVDYFSDAPGQAGGPFEGNGLDAQAMNILLDGDPASAEYAAAYSHLIQPKVTFDPATQKLVTISPDLSWAREPSHGAPSAGSAMPATDRPGPTVANAQAQQPMQPAPFGQATQPAQPAGVETMQVPGATIRSSAGGVKMSPEEATKFTALQEGVTDIQSAMDLLAPGGAVNEIGVMTGQSALGIQGVPFSSGRQARQQMQRGIEGILRAMTGAAAPESEVDRYMGMFFPSPTDNDKAAVEKMQKARIWAQGVIDQMKVGRPQLQGGPASIPMLPGGGTRVDQLPAGNWQ